MVEDMTELLIKVLEVFPEGWKIDQYEFNDLVRAVNSIANHNGLNSKIKVIPSDIDNQ